MLPEMAAPTWINCWRGDGYLGVFDDGDFPGRGQPYVAGAGYWMWASEGANHTTTQMYNYILTHIEDMWGSHTGAGYGAGHT